MTRHKGVNMVHSYISLWYNWKLLCTVVLIIELILLLIDQFKSKFIEWIILFDFFQTILSNIFIKNILKTYRKANSFNNIIDISNTSKNYLK